jgi:hypothetical protein
LVRTGEGQRSEMRGVEMTVTTPDQMQMLDRQIAAPRQIGE